MNEPAVLRPLTLGQLLDTTFSMYRQNFVLFFGVAALPYLIMLGFQLVMLVFQVGGMNSGFAIGAFLLSMLGTLFFYFLSLAITQAASFFAVSAVHLREPITIGGAFSRVKGHLLVVIGTIILVYIAGFVGLFFLIVPGVIIWLGLCCSIPAALFENLDPIDSMKRSWELMTGAKGKAFLIYILYYAILFAISWILMFVVMLAMGAAAAAARGSVGMPIGIMVAQQVISFLVNAAVAPIVTVGVTLLYYDQRVRKEAFDLQHMMSVLGSRPPSPPAQAAGAGIS